jgi:arabinofuranosyltransferase
MGQPSTPAYPCRPPRPNGRPGGRLLPPSSAPNAPTKDVTNAFTNVLSAAILVGAILAIAVSRNSLSRVPFEDAAMLLRYADNLALGHGFRWNVDEPPVDGATDFGVVALLGMSSRLLGIGPLPLLRALSLLTHAITSLLVYAGVLRATHARLPAFSLGLVVALGPGTLYTESLFATNVFALATTVLWMFARHSLQPTVWRSVILGLLCVACGLLRPEGALFAALLLLALCTERRHPLLMLSLATLVFITLGSAYFTWRWLYFSHPFPTPFYKKGGWELHPESLRAAFQAIAMMAWPATPFLLGLRRPLQTFRLSTILVILGFLAAWIALSNEMNFANRFQYPILSVLLLALADGLPSSSNGRLGRVSHLASVTTILFCVARLTSLPPPHADDGRTTIATRLATVPGAQQRRMATTEAGLLPYLSGWKALDAWGLNEHEIATRGRLERSDLDDFQPDLVMLHRVEGYRHLEPSSFGGRWWSMTNTLESWALERGYRLVGDWGCHPGDTHRYYLAPGSQELEFAFAISHYPWFSGCAARDYNSVGPSPSRPTD